MVIKRRYTEIILLLATINGNAVFFNTASAQDPSSFYFTQAQPKGSKYITAFPKNWHGTYNSDKDSTLRLHISHDSVYTEAPLAMFLPFKDVDNDKYVFMDSLLSVNGDTLPCWKHDDTLYFYIYLNKTIYKNSANKKLFLSEDQILLSTMNEKGNWETSLFINQGMAVELAYFDHSAKTELLDKKKKVKKEKNTTRLIYYASFKEKEWLTMLNEEWFPYRQRFNRIY